MSRTPETVSVADVDAGWLVDELGRLVALDSPVGYHAAVLPYLEGRLAEWGYATEVDNKHTLYVRVPGRDRSRCVCVGAHLDTVGLVVSAVLEDGELRVRRVGGISYQGSEGATCRVLCRDGSVVVGQVRCEHHSVHASEQSSTAPRTDDTMRVSLAADVSSAADARALGVGEGALVALAPEFEALPNGYVLSRFVDDKGAVAVALDVLRWLAEEGVRPAFDTLFAFPVYEEVCHGGAYVPDGVSEYVALDITLVGEGYGSDEHQVGIIAGDAHGPYDWDLTNLLVRVAGGLLDEGAWNVQVPLDYSTDAMAAQILGANVAAAAFGPACTSTHGRERCHADALARTDALCRAYVVGAGRDGRG